MPTVSSESLKRKSFSTMNLLHTPTHTLYSYFGCSTLCPRSQLIRLMMTYLCDSKSEPSTLLFLLFSPFPAFTVIFKTCFGCLLSKDRQLYSRQVPSLPQAPIPTHERRSKKISVAFWLPTLHLFHSSNRTRVNSFSKHPWYKIPKWNFLSILSFFFNFKHKTL